MARPKKEHKVNESINTDNSLFHKTVKILGEKYGEGIIESLTKTLERPLIGTSTGSLALDYIICPDVGGVPKGQVIEFYGPYSSGKTTLALGLCANATVNKEYVAYVDAEGSLNAKIIKNSGVDGEYFHFVDHPDARKSAMVVETLMKSGEVGVVVIDSLPVWRPAQEATKGKEEIDFTKQRMASQSSFLTDAIIHLARVARENKVILVLLNQIRYNLSGYGSPIKPFGGRAIEHLDGIRIKLSGKASSSADRILDPTNDLLVGQYTTAIADKNKTSIPMQEAKLPLFLCRGVNPYMELVTLSLKTGLVDGPAGRYKWVDSGEPIVYGLNNFAQKLYDDTELYTNLRSKVIEKLGLKYHKDRKVMNAFHDSLFNKIEPVLCSNDLSKISNSKNVDFDDEITET